MGGCFRGRCRAACWLVTLASVAVVGRGSSAEDDSFSTAEMLEACLKQASSSAASLSPAEGGGGITESCLGASTAEAWKTGFQAAVNQMLEKKRRSMQHGLAGAADAVSATYTCGDTDNGGSSD